MKNTFRKIINSTEYAVEVWGKFEGERYKFGIQAIPRKGQPYPFAGWVSVEFIEDEIDNDKNLDYLERVVQQMAENHLEDMMTLNQHAVIKNIQWWFKEAKKELENKNG